MTLRHFDIAIIGSGIAGGALAVALKDSGLSMLLLDRRSGPLDTARGDHIQPAMQPVLSRWDVLDRLLQAGAEQCLDAQQTARFATVLCRYEPRSRCLCARCARRCAERGDWGRFRCPDVATGLLVGGGKGAT